MLKAITLDFWSTIVDGTSTPERALRRMARLHEHIVGAGHACTVDELRAAFRRVLQRVDEDAKESLIDIGPPGRWQLLAAELGILDGQVSYEVFEQAYADITLNPPPEMMPYIEQAIADVHQMGFKLGIICNTGMAGGNTLREVLRHYGLFDSFDVTVFSNEFGYSKPDPRIFEHTLEELGNVPPSEALHVGDLEELDVEGARRAGMHSALYEPYGDVPETQAELIVRDWRAFAGQITNLTAPPDDGRSIAQQ